MDGFHRVSKQNIWKQCYLMLQYGNEWASCTRANCYWMPQLKYLAVKLLLLGVEYGMLRFGTDRNNGKTHM